MKILSTRHTFLELSQAADKRIDGMKTIIVNTKEVPREL